MKFDVLFETTVWKTGYDVPNHTYLVNGTKAYAFIRRGEKPIYFSKGLHFDKRNRSFMKLKGNPFNLTIVNV